MRTAVVIAAMPLEIDGIVAAIRGNGRFRITRDKNEISIETSGYRMVLFAEGPGFRLARESVSRIRQQPDVLLSAGICGALDDSLQVGDIFVASHVNGMECSFPETSRKFVSGPLISQDRIAGSAEERSRLRSTGAMAVDMEAAVVAQQAAAWRVPFYCVKAVSDTANEEFLLDLNAARDGSGRFSVPAIIGQALRRPWVGLPELLRLKRNGELAAKRLGEFFADCSF